MNHICPNSLYDGDPLPDPIEYRSVVKALQYHLSGYLFCSKPSVSNHASTYNNSLGCYQKNIVLFEEHSCSWSLCQPGSLRLEAYSYIENPVDCRFTSSYCIYLG